MVTHPDVMSQCDAPATEPFAVTQRLKCVHVGDMHVRLLSSHQVEVS
jgi:hypothetical protein